MTPERWERVKAIAQGALARVPAERAAFAAHACGSDDELAREVDSLLAADSEAGNFIETPALARPELAAILDHVQGAMPWPGRRLGAYSVMREIGHGGMGAVYLAVRADDEYRKQVAIKVVRSTFDAAFIHQRFRHERQILADLDHSNIARLIDGGSTDEGAPYFVMEFVDGLPIDQYCDANHLSVDARLALFQRVCDGVHYAHQHLVVHRDLKANNILVTADGTPKLLDFGIAKLVDSDGRSAENPTLTVMRVMTLESASPEQVRGEMVTTATDVYALGVLLHRLLTGRGPYDADTTTPHDLAREICETDARRPSEVTADPGVARRLKGDLDTIVLKALQKHPARRYGSVEQFSQDVARHVRSLPVLARPDTLRYRVTKFVTRHKLGALASAVIVASLIGGIVATAWEAHIARQQRSRAERRFNDVRRLANSVVFEFNDALRDVPGSVQARKLIVTRAIEYLNRLSEQEVTDAALTSELANAYLQVGDILGNPTMPNLGDSAGALASYGHALTLYERVSPGSDETRTGLARAHSALGLAAWSAGDSATAREHYRQSFQLFEELARTMPTNPARQRDAATAAFQLGQAELRLTDIGAATSSYQRALDKFGALLASDPADNQSRRYIVLAYIKLADCDTFLGNEQRALQRYQSANALLTPLLSGGVSPVDMQRVAALLWSRLAEGMSDSSPLEAEAFARRAIDTVRPMAEADPSNAQAFNDLGFTARTLGAILLARHREQDARTTLVESVRALETTVAVNPGYIEARRELGDAHRLLGEVARRTHDPAGALAEYDAALHFLEAPDTIKQMPRTVAELYESIGDAHSALARNAPTHVAQAQARRSALVWYDKSQSQWTEIAKARPLTPNDVKSREEVNRKAAVR